MQARGGQLRYRGVRQALPVVRLFRSYNPRDKRAREAAAATQPFDAAVDHSRLECLVQFYASYGWHSSLIAVK